MEILTEDTINISEWMEYTFQDVRWYWGSHTDKTEGKIGIWIGVSQRVGSALCYWVLTEKVNITSRTTVQHVTLDESENPKIQHGSIK